MKRGFTRVQRAKGGEYNRCSVGVEARVWQTMSGHDPALLLEPSLRRKRRRGRSDRQESRRKKRQRGEKRGEKTDGQAHTGVKRAIKRDATARSPNLGCRSSTRDCSIETVNRGCDDCSTSASISYLICFQIYIYIYIYSGWSIFWRGFRSHRAMIFTINFEVVVLVVCWTFIEHWLFNFLIVDFW